ncbi:MAG TPA: hypothetical protein VMJ32_09300 [Pirellulales bacterium]|nr:hypothetical protein [Pirellulales bacterium]
MTLQIENASRELKKVYNILAEDVEAVRAYGKSNPSPFAHRTLFRTYFALVEGLSYQFRKLALACAEYKPDLFTKEEIILLKEQKFILSNEGEPVTIHAGFQKPLPSILFTMRCCAKAYGASFLPDTNIQIGYTKMKEFITLRNGLTHPNPPPT